MTIYVVFVQSARNFALRAPIRELQAMQLSALKIVLFANSDWYIYNFRKKLATNIIDEGNKVIIATTAGSYSDKLVKENFQHVIVPMIRLSINPFRELFVLVWLWKFFRAEKPDIVHSFTLKCAIYAGILLRFGGAPHVVSIDGLGYVFSSQALYARLLRPLLLCLMKFAFNNENSVILVQNRANYEFFIENKLCPAGRLMVVESSGVDIERFRPPVQVEQGDAEPMKVLFAARLLWGKGLREFVEAAKLLLSDKRRIKFLLAGAPDPGSPESATETYILDLVENGVVLWLGHVTNMQDLYRTVDVVVLPTKYGEGLPTTLIEAAACERAIIATDVPGCREVVSHQQNGLLVRPGNVEELRRAIMLLHDDSELRGRLGRAARMNVIEKFDVRIVNSKILKVYRDIYCRDVASEAKSNAFKRS